MGEKKIIEEIRDANIIYDVDYLTSKGEKRNATIKIAEADIINPFDIDEMILEEVEKLEDCDCGLREVIYVGRDDEDY